MAPMCSARWDGRPGMSRLAGERPDWVGCARALMERGVPKAVRDPEHENRVLIDGRRMSFSEEVTEVLVEGVRGSVAGG